MTDLSPLQRAHALSAQATHLLRPNSSSSSQTMHKALDSYRQAAELFHRSAGDVIGDDGAKRTLELLTVQHRKLAKDLERRMGAMVLSGGGASSAGISSSRQAGLVTNVSKVDSGGFSLDPKSAADENEPLWFSPTGDDSFL